MTPKETKSLYHKARRRELLSNGLCGICGKNKTEKNYTECPSCKDKYKGYKERLRSERKESGVCLRCGGPRVEGSVHCESCNEGLRKTNKKIRLKVKMEALVVYADSYPPECSCCGEGNIEFLTLDHINNDGKEERSELKGYGDYFYRWLKKTNYASNLQVLCMNCNWGRRVNGICPHKKEIPEIKLF